MTCARCGYVAATPFCGQCGDKLHPGGLVDAAIADAVVSWWTRMGKRKNEHTRAELIAEIISAVRGPMDALLVAKGEVGKRDEAKAP